MSLIPSQYIHLINWRSYSDYRLIVPSTSSVIVDRNGSGKTSYLAAIYSLLVNQPWINLKYADMCSVGTSYFGIQTQNPDWYLVGKQTPSGRLSVQHSLPNGITLPRVVSYIPNDNQWLFLERSGKLAALDRLIVGVEGINYQELLKNLNLNIKNKQALLNRYNETGIDDIISARNYTQNIINISHEITKKRLKYLNSIQDKLPQYSQWLERNMQIEQIYYTPDQFGKRIPFKNSELNKLIVDIDQCWNLEKKSSKILFGSQRDDFSFVWNHRNIETILSRGEMRLFVLFCKHIASILAQDNTKVIWLLDDVFNEFDTIRESTLLNQILRQSDGFLATATHHHNLEIPELSIQDLKQKT